MSFHERAVKADKEAKENTCRARLLNLFMDLSRGSAHARWIIV